MRPELKVCLGTAALLCNLTVKSSAQERPNILFIMADDHTSQSWGIYGGILEKHTPDSNIKRLAAKGCVLNNCFCTNSICVPSRASIMTGQYSNRNGVYTLSDGLPTESGSVAKILQQNGYETALFGKWHLKKEPAGFETYKVLPGQGRYQNPYYLTKGNWRDNETGGTEYQGFETDITTSFAIDWMKNRDDKKPFFLMCHFKATHEPWEYAERFENLYQDADLPYPSGILDFGKETTGRTFKGQQLEILGSRWVQASLFPGKGWTSYPGLPFSLEGLDSIQARKKIYQKFVKDYLRCAAGINDNLGKILDYLEETGLDKNTVVIYTSDQGYFLGEHGFFDKRMIYEESLRMPFVICYPKEIKGGKRIDDIILNIDFPALFLDYAGVKKPEDMQGESFRENLRGKTPGNWRKSMYYRYWENEPLRPAHLGIRNERYKLALFYGQPKASSSKKIVLPDLPAWEFYDLKKDPQETRNAVEDPRYRAVIAEMRKELIKLREDYQDTDDGDPVIQDIVTRYLYTNEINER
ncbi:MAG: sulfatase [Prolixibacteraceae bacterium]|nr:sulfatase [Prolixibacteraceae bacterium]